MSRFATSARTRPHAVAAFAALGILATTALLAAPAAASASQPVADGLQTNVYYDARDLATERGIRALYRRIENAAQEVCPGYDSLAASAVAASQQCQRRAIARAIGQIGNAQLAAIDADRVAAAARRQG